MIKEGNEQHHYFTICIACKYGLIKVRMATTLLNSVHTHDLQLINVLYNQMWKDHMTWWLH